MKQMKTIKNLFKMSLRFACIMMLFMMSGRSFAIQINQSYGWMEEAFVTWQYVSGASRYQVSYTNSEGVETTIDNSLIRRYPDYLRADILRVPAGEYQIYIRAYDQEGKLIDSATTDKVSVKVDNREGFAFTDGNIPGGYQMNGMPKDGARIIYVTSNNVNTVSCDVNNNKGIPSTYTGLVNILNAYGKGYDKTPLIVRIVGTLKDTDVEGIKDGNYLNLQGSNNTTRSLENLTIEGVGDDAVLYGFGLCFKRTLNVEIRNLAIMLFGDDAISMDTDNRHIWIHNIDFFYGKPGSDADQVKGDGSIDMKYHSTDVTIAYNHFFDNGKVMGCGGTTGENENLRITFQHNWFDHTDSRCPRLHYTTAHIYNNYYDGVCVYGIGNTTESSAFIENNYFREVKRPMMISGQGTDKYDESKGTYTLKGTFSGQNGGMTKAYNNVFVNTKTTRKLVYQTDNATQFDAYLVSSRDEQIPETVKSVTGQWAYSNFDTVAGFYTSVPDPAEDIPAIVTEFAGRINGGDFKWTFDNDADDEDHEVNTFLKNSITSYKSTLLGFQNEQTTAIHSLESDENVGTVVYNLAGQQVNQLNIGLNIIKKGKKVQKVFIP